MADRPEAPDRSLRSWVPGGDDQHPHRCGSVRARSVRTLSSGSRPEGRTPTRLYARDVKRFAGAVLLLTLLSGSFVAAKAAQIEYPPIQPERYDAAGTYLWFEHYQYGHVPVYDEAGIPRREMFGRLVYNPVFITQHGLRMWSLWATRGDRHALGVARQIGRWLLANQTRGGRWLYEFDFPLAGINATMQSPWGSAMQQGQAMSLLTRLWRLDRDRRWLVAARRAVRPLLRPISDGYGMTAFFLGHPFYEEYPTQPSSFTLNGFMFTLIGLHDLASTGRAPVAKRLFQIGLRTLRVALPWYDRNGKTSAYHLSYLTNPLRLVPWDDRNGMAIPGRLGYRPARLWQVHADDWYHRVHVIELQALADIAGSRVLRGWRDRWEQVPLEKRDVTTGPQPRGDRPPP